MSNKLASGFLALSMALPGLSSAEMVSMVVMPDSQWYVENDPEIIEDQIGWIVANENAENIVYVAQLGDLKDDSACDNKVINAGTGAGRTEWQIVDQAFAELEAAGIAYGVLPGNHDFDSPCPTYAAGDRPLTAYDGVFGPARFAAAPFYGDPSVPTPGNRVMGSNEDNFTLFESAGVRFIAINLGFRAGGPTDGEVAWANGLLASYPDRLGILTTHYFLNSSPPLGVGDLDAFGNAVYSGLVSNPNFFLMLSAHNRGESWFIATDGRGSLPPVHALMSNYQSIAFPDDGDGGTGPDNPNAAGINFGALALAPSGEGDSGFMRIMRFDTETRMVNIETFIPPVVTGGKTRNGTTDPMAPMANWQDLVSNNIADTPADMTTTTASNLGISFEGYVPLPVLIDFETDQSGTPYAGQFDSFAASEYNGAVFNDSDGEVGSTFVNLINPANSGTAISGYYANVGAFMGVSTSMTIEFTSPVSEVEFDFALPDGNISVEAFDAGNASLGIFPFVGADTFVNQSGFDVLAGQVSISGVGNISSIVIDPTPNETLILDNLRFWQVP